MSGTRRLRVGVETSVAAFDHAGTGRYSRELIRALRAEAPADVEIVEIRARDVSLRRGWKRTLFVLFWEGVYCPLLLRRRARAERLDLLHCTAPSPILGRFPCPVVTTVHDAILFSHPEWFTPLRRLRARRWWRRAAAYDHVLASSLATRDALVRYLRVDGARMDAVSLGCDLSPLPASADREPFLLAVGTLEPRKNLLGALEALALVKRRCGHVPPLYVAGAVGWGDVRVREHVGRLGLRDDVRLLGFVSDERLRQLYSDALALLYLSLDEGFGFPPLEAMACGCPVIASRAGSIPEVMGDTGMLVDPLASEHVADAIESLLADPGRARSLGERGRERAAAFRWSRCARETLEVYRRLGRPAGADRT